MAEILVVLGIIAILSAISIPYLLSYRKVYRTDDQAIKMIDVMTEASQMALTRRRSMRVEIDLTSNAILLIDERNPDPGTQANEADQLVKKIPFEKAADVRVDALPSGVAKPNPPNYTDASFATDALGHLEGGATVSGHNVWFARFLRNGSVVNAAGTPISVNIYIWPPMTPGSLTPRNKVEVRAITIFGGSGAVRYWKHNGTTFVAQ